MKSMMGVEEANDNTMKMNELFFPEKETFFI